MESAGSADEPQYQLRPDSLLNPNDQDSGGPESLRERSFFQEASRIMNDNDDTGAGQRTPEQEARDVLNSVEGLEPDYEFESVEGVASPEGDGQEKPSSGVRNPNFLKLFSGGLGFRVRSELWIASGFDPLTPKLVVLVPGLAARHSQPEALNHQPLNPMT